jgi:hypothetical protein
LSKGFHAALTLADVLEQLEPVGMTERLCHQRELDEESMFRTIA